MLFNKNTLIPLYICAIIIIGCGTPENRQSQIIEQNHDDEQNQHPKIIFNQFLILENKINEFEKEGISDCQYCKSSYPNPLLKDHTKKCVEKKQKCESCKNKMARKDLISHQKVCKINCKYCGKEILGVEKNTHENTECPKLVNKDYLSNKLNEDKKTRTIYEKYFMNKNGSKYKTFEDYIRMSQGKTCPYCKCFYQKIDDLIEHIENCGEIKKCKICTQKFSLFYNKNHEHNCQIRNSIPSIKNNKSVEKQVTDTIKKVFGQEKLYNDQNKASKIFKKSVIALFSKNKSIKNKLLILAGEPGTGKSWFANQAHRVMEILEDESSIIQESQGISSLNNEQLRILNRKLIVYSDVSFNENDIEDITCLKQPWGYQIDSNLLANKLLKPILAIDECTKQEISPIVMLTTNLSLNMMKSLVNRLEKLVKKEILKIEKENSEVKYMNYKKLYSAFSPYFLFIKYFESPHHTILFNEKSKRKLQNNRHNLKNLDELESLINKGIDDKYGNIVFIPKSKIDEVKNKLKNIKFVFKDEVNSDFTFTPTIDSYTKPDGATGYLESPRGKKGLIMPIIEANELREDLFNEYHSLLRQTHKALEIGYLLIIPIEGDDENIAELIQEEKEKLTQENEELEKKGLKKIDAGLLDRCRTAVYYLE